MGDKLNYRHVIFISLLVFAVYFNSLWGGFIWDDQALVLHNSLIKNFANIGRIFTSSLAAYSEAFYRPAQALSYMLDFFLYKFNPAGYHLTSIFLHIFASLLAYKLFLLLIRDSAVSFFAALLYSVSPLWVESVSYISGRADILMAIFIISSFILFLKERILLSLVFYIFALFSKEASLAYPLILILYMAVFARWRKNDAYTLIGFSAITLIYLFLRAMIFTGPDIAMREHSVYIRALYFIKALPRYIGLIFFPVNQTMSYTAYLSKSFFSKSVLAAFAALMLLGGLFTYCLKKEKVISFFLGWFFVFLLPYSGIVPINAFFADHFAYLASLGIFICGACFLRKVKYRPVFFAVVFGYAVFFSFATIKYNFVWQDPVRLYQRTIRLSPNAFGAYNNLGVIYLDKGDFKKAEELLKKAIVISPDFQEARLNLARFYYLKEDYSRAIGLARGVLEANPSNFMAYNWLGTFYFKTRQLDLALDCYKEAVRLNPRLIPLRADLYNFYKTVGSQAQAQRILQEISRLDKYALARIYFQESVYLLESDKFEDALGFASKALEIDASNKAFYNLKSYILKKRGSLSGGEKGN